VNVKRGSDSPAAPCVAAPTPHPQYPRQPGLPAAGAPTGDAAPSLGRLGHDAAFPELALPGFQLRRCPSPQRRQTEVEGSKGESTKENSRGAGLPCRTSTGDGRAPDSRSGVRWTPEGRAGLLKGKPQNVGALSPCSPDKTSPLPTACRCQVLLVPTHPAASPHLLQGRFCSQTPPPQANQRTGAAALSRTETTPSPAPTGDGGIAVLGCAWPCPFPVAAPWGQAGHGRGARTLQGLQRSAARISCGDGAAETFPGGPSRVACARGPCRQQDGACLGVPSSTGCSPPCRDGLCAGPPAAGVSRPRAQGRSLAGVAAVVGCLGSRAEAPLPRVSAFNVSGFLTPQWGGGLLGSGQLAALQDLNPALPGLASSLLAPLGQCLGPLSLPFPLQTQSLICPCSHLSLPDTRGRQSPEPAPHQHPATGASVSPAPLPGAAARSRPEGDLGFGSRRPPRCHRPHWGSHAGVDGCRRRVWSCKPL